MSHRCSPQWPQPQLLFVAFRPPQKKRRNKSDWHVGDNMVPFVFKKTGGKGKSERKRNQRERERHQRDTRGVGCGLLTDLWQETQQKDLGRPLTSKEKLKLKLKHLGQCQSVPLSKPFSRVWPIPRGCRVKAMVGAINGCLQSPKKAIGLECLDCLVHYCFAIVLDM